MESPSEVYTPNSEERVCQPAAQSFLPDLQQLLPGMNSSLGGECGVCVCVGGVLPTLALHLPYLLPGFQLLCVNY